MNEYKDENGNKVIDSFMDYRMEIKDNYGNSFIPTYPQNIGLLEEV